MIVVHGDIKNMCASTIEFLSDYLDEDGVVLSVGRPGPYLNGVADQNAFENLFAKYGWNMVGGLEKLQTMLTQRLKPRICSKAPWPTGVNHRIKELENGDSIYSMATFDTMIALPGIYAEKPLYEAAAVVKGYVRPYGLPNLWMATMAERPWLKGICRAQGHRGNPAPIQRRAGIRQFP